MPIERISKGFKDISASFKVNPLNDDLIHIKNETAIARSIRNLILTNMGERPFSPILGCNITGLLFENPNSMTASAIETQIETTIRNYEPRVKLKDVKVKSNDDEYNVNIDYFIIGIDAIKQQLSFALQSTR